jgi:hypothetical protein
MMPSILNHMRFLGRMRAIRREAAAVLPTCSTCRWYAHAQGTDRFGCHRFPPVSGSRPLTKPSDWCGEHERRHA